MQLHVAFLEHVVLDGVSDVERTLRLDVAGRAALSEGNDLWESARFAQALAALSVQKIGTTPSMPTREEIDAFLAEQTKGE